jgi:hypothetical protein
MLGTTFPFKAIPASWKVPPGWMRSQEGRVYRVPLTRSKFHLLPKLVPDARTKLKSTPQTADVPVFLKTKRYSPPPFQYCTLTREALTPEDPLGGGGGGGLDPEQLIPLF